MKKIAYLLVLLLFVMVRTAAFAEDRYFFCKSGIGGITGKTYENLVIDLDGCLNENPDRQNVSLLFQDITVTGETRITGKKSGMKTASVRFTGSDLNELYADCSGMENCEIGIDGTVSIGKLDLRLAENAEENITVVGLAETSTLPDYCSAGYLCEGQPEFSPYEEASNEFDFRMKDLEAFSDMGYIGETVIRVSGKSAAAFNNVWLHRVSIVSEDPGGQDEITLNTSGFTYMDLLDSGIPFTLHNRNERHFSGTIPFCSAVASDYMRIGLMLLHSSGDLSVSMDNQYIERLVFFGNGCENSTLFLKDRTESGIVSYIEKASIYDANAEFYSKKIPYAEFLVAPEGFSMYDFHEYFGFVKSSLMSRCLDLPDMLDRPGMCWNAAEFPEETSEYWDRMESSAVWSRLSGYVNPPAAETGDPSRPYAYGFHETDIPYFYTKAAFIDTVRYSSAYGVPENSIPPYIAGKGWSNVNPTLNADKTARIAWNGGCSYNHDMTVGGITYRNSLESLPYPDE